MNQDPPVGEFLEENSRKPWKTLENPKTTLENPEKTLGNVEKALKNSRGCWKALFLRLDSGHIPIVHGPPADLKRRSEPPVRFFVVCFVVFCSLFLPVVLCLLVWRSWAPGLALLIQSNSLVVKAFAKILVNGDSLSQRRFEKVKAPTSNNTPSQNSHTLNPNKLTFICFRGFKP